MRSMFTGLLIFLRCSVQIQMRDHEEYVQWPVDLDAEYEFQTPA